MARSEQEVRHELPDLKLSWREVAVQDLAVRELAGRLEASEHIEDAVYGIGNVPFSIDTTAVCLAVTPFSVIVLAVKQGGWFSSPSLSTFSRLRLEDVIDIRCVFTSAENTLHKSPGYDISVHTVATKEHVHVPSAYASQERVEAFVTGLRSRCPMLQERTAVPSSNSFKAELIMLTELRAAGHLSDAEVADAIRKLIRN